MKRVFYDTRASLCPECHRLLPADYVEDDEGLKLEKHCPEHGPFSTRVAGSHRWLSGLQEYAASTCVPAQRQTASAHGCPADCGECDDHRQKAAFFLFEITSGCDLDCPICLGEPCRPGRFVSIGEMEAMVAAVLDYSGPEVCATLGGGEPTIHPQFFELVDVLKKAGMGTIWVYTNGRRIARDPAFAARLADENLYVVLQWDGFSDEICRRLRGRPLMEEKRQALQNLLAGGARLGLCPTVVAGVNDDQLGRLYRMFADTPRIGTLDIATMAFVGKGREFVEGRQNRTTSHDVLLALEAQTGGEIRADDFSPVSFSHPECLQIAYLLAAPDGRMLPLKRFLEPADYKTLVLDTALLQLTAGAESLLHDVVNRLWAAGKEDPTTKRGLAAMRYLVDQLYPQQEKLSEAQRQARSMDLVKVVLVHSYMDGLNFDLGRTRKCISRTVLPDGRLMPTCAYNVVHRTAPPADRPK
jgi:hypothetical protein